jgi:hypothetical protein
MHPIRNITDWYFWFRPVRKKALKNLSAHRAMETTNPIDRSTSPDRQVSHIEGFISIVRYRAAKCEELREIDAKAFSRVSPKIPFNQTGREAVEAGFHRGMCRKEITRSRDRQCYVKRLSAVLHEAARSFDYGEGGVSFIQVTNFRFDTEASQ